MKVLFVANIFILYPQLSPAMSPSVKITIGGNVQSQMSDKGYQMQRNVTGGSAGTGSVAGNTPTQMAQATDHHTHYQQQMASSTGPSPASLPTSVIQHKPPNTSPAVAGMFYFYFMIYRTG